MSAPRNSCSVEIASNRNHNRSFFIMTSSISDFALLCLLGLSSCFLGLAEAGPRYIAIPIDGVDVIELNPVGPSSQSRFLRQTEPYKPVAESTVQQVRESMLEQPMRPERPTAHILDYVDFGGQTGPNGAFSWYADYPSSTHH